MKRVEDIIFKQHSSNYLVRGFFSFASAHHVIFALEYMPGGDLATMLSAVGCLPEAQVNFYFAEVLLGLQYLHDEGVVHHDVKPQNMLVSATGHLKLTDFGLSSTLRRQQSWCGTMPYVAPEALLGRTASFAVDMWSYGVVMWEMLTGDQPIPCLDPDLTPRDMLAAIDEATDESGVWLPRSSAHMMGISQSALDLCVALLVVDPAQRLDCAALREHPFFEGTRWEHRDLETPPFVPNLSCDDDVTYFRGTDGFQPRFIKPALSDEDDSSDELNDASGLHRDSDSFKGGVHSDHLVRLSLSEVSQRSSSSSLSCSL